MEFITPILEVASAGVDQILSAASVAALAWGGYLVARLVPVVSAGVPAIFRALIAALLEKALMPVVVNAVRAAEEYGARAAKSGLARAGQSVSDAKLAVAKAYILARVPDWVVPDAQLSSMIDAALVTIGRGATKGIEIGVDFVESKLEGSRPPASVN